MKKNLFLLMLSMFLCASLQAKDKLPAWGKHVSKEKQWVKNISRPNRIKRGLEGRHFSIWASHGRYYDQKTRQWKWQRPNLFGTTEDLFTQTFVVPYLFPMLENAGAVVVSPRERDWQKQEIIVDNDDAGRYYTETNNGKMHWRMSAGNGFAFRSVTYKQGENPFQTGTVREIETTNNEGAASFAVYQPNLKAAGKYAVYVSYKTLPNSTDEVEYIVNHKGQETVFRVNQQMGGGTWVYLGTFEFDKGCNIYNRVVITNYSKTKGVVTTDAVRFGGGMGNIEREGSTSQLPRALEGARYYTQWAGAPIDVYSKSDGTNDYNDDINARSLFTNWLAGGSSYVPNKAGKRVPLEMALAIHSDAGYKADGGIVGTLGIYTTKNGEPTLATGMSRDASRILAEQLVGNIKKDLEATFKRTWNIRSITDQNYSETRLPAVPSTIIETLSHQNFQDIRLGHDPNFKFAFARSIYKTILKYSSELHDTRYVVQPLAPNNFRIEFVSKNKVRLSWNSVEDPLEETADAKSFNVYTAIGTGGFDNGVNTKKKHFELKLEPNIIYNFKVTACNKGGESFSTEILSAYHQEGAKQTILVINGFHRLASPAQIDTPTQQGFNLEADPGISYGATAGWSGRQSNFDRQLAGREGNNALGYGGNELVGKFIAGNDFDYTKTHTEAIITTRKYNVVSCASEAIENRYVKLKDYDAVDLILGLEKEDDYSLVRYKALKPKLQEEITKYLNRQGRIFVSGAYLASDMKTMADRNWLASYLKVGYECSNEDNQNTIINGMKMNFNIFRSINEEHYGAYSPDVLRAYAGAFGALSYPDGGLAAVANKSANYRSFVMAFPFECIKEKEQRNTLMRSILQFLME